MRFLIRALAQFVTLFAESMRASRARVGSSSVGRAQRTFWIFLLAPFLSGCAGIGAVASNRTVRDEVAAPCLATFDALDARIDAEGVRDAQDTRIEGFPYLRVSRLLERFAPQAREHELKAWMEKLAALDHAARRFELANLPEPTRARLEALARSTHRVELEESIESCRRRLIARDLTSEERMRLLRERAVVPADYSQMMRIFGLYPLTSLFFAQGIERLEARLRATFDAPRLPTEGRRTRYAPVNSQTLTSADVRAIMQRAEDSVFGLHEPVATDREILLAAFAPEFVVDEAGPYDRIGALRWSEWTSPAVDVDEPLVYTRIAHTVVGGRPLLQLVYTIWFTERPPDGSFDLVAGRLDGLVWRVTLTPDGEPWIFDSIHPCGCYHQFFPTARAQRRPAPNGIEEWAFTPRHLERADADERLSVYLASRTHYIQNIEIAARASADRRYRLVDDDVLRSMPMPGGGRRSAFGPDGIVPGTERAERFLFWPMGIANPGAMRQWGRHATAFVGIRHFDEPDLLDRRFLLLERRSAD